MIYFVSNKEHDVLEVEKELQIKNTLTPQDIDWIVTQEVLGLDTETSGLDPYSAEILLLILGNEEHQYVIDADSEDCEKLFLTLIERHNGKIGTDYKTTRRYNKVVLGANIKFDFKFFKVKYNIELMKMFDVMIAEQRLLQGQTQLDLKTNRKVQVSSALDKIVQRRLGYIPNEMDKRIREQFIGANKKTFRFNNKHIFYSAGDVKHLPKIREIQKQLIAYYNLNFLIYHIEFPLIRVLANAELIGENINETMWRQNIVNNNDKRFETQCILDEEFRRLRDTILPVNDRIWLSTGKFDRIRTKQVEVKQENLFGDLFAEIEVDYASKRKSKTKSKPESPYLNYTVGEVVNILGRLNLAVPTHISNSKQPGEPCYPQFIISKGKAKVDKSLIEPYSFTTGADALESFVTENPSYKGKEFIKKLIDLRTYETRLNTFGENFLIKFKNPITKRFHTIYRQCHAVTGRLQSGDKDNGWYNSQNLPKEKEYRLPFHDEDNYYVTTDLSGAEAVIMIDKARDEKFYQMAIVNDDAHSPLATAVWRAIGRHRLQFAFGGEHKKQAIELSNIVISKEQNKDKRTDFKPHTFGDIYGMGDKKRAKVLGVSIEESKIAGATQKAMIPKTYKMVSDNAKFAVNNGYLILNNRTNSRIWYSEILEIHKSGNNPYDREFSNIKHEAESSAKNSPIQGTQADMVKEIMVEIDREADRQNIDIVYNLALLKQVHDETGYRFDGTVNIPETLVEFVNDDKKKGIEMVTIPEFIKRWHTQVANRYLTYITMAAEQHVGKTWTK